MRQPCRIAAALASFVFAFSALAAINGTVMTTDGQPVAGARVSIYGFESVDARRVRLLSQSPEAVPIASTQTDAKGSFSLASPKDAVVDLTVVARGLDPMQLRVERDDEVGAIAVRRNTWKSGSVTAGGKPLAGATVVILYANGFEHVVRTGEDGRYEAPDPKNARSIAALHPEYAVDEEMLMLTGASATALHRKLTAGSQLSGRVVGLDGETPAAKAAITLDGWPLATSGDDGTFTIAHVPAKWTSLIARKDALLGSRSFSKEASHKIRLAKAATFSGRIIDSKTKLPVPSASIRMILPRMGPGEPAGSAISDAKGAFSLVVPPGSYFMIASHPGYDLGQNDISAAGGQTASKDVSLTPRARISGVVVDEERKPVAAAIVASEDVSSPMGFPMRMMRGGSNDTASGPDGRFSIRVPADSDLRLRATKKGLPTAKTETMKLGPSERKTGVVLTIPSGVLVTGRVTDAENNPLSGVAVTTMEAEAGRGGGPMQRIIIAGLQQSDEDAVLTASDGTFSLRLKEGTYDFTFKREGYTNESVRAQNVSASGENLVEASLRPAVEIRGRVVRNGAGVEGVLLFAMLSGSDARSMTGPDGSFTVGGLAPGSVRLSLRKDDEFVQEMRTVTAPASDVVIDLPAGGRVTGRVVEKGSNKPIAQFQAGLSRSRSSGGMVMMAPPQLQNFTSEDGSFSLENVPTGAHDLVASAPGYAGGRVNITVEEGKTLADIVVELDAGTRLTGRVTGPNGAPLSDATVRVAMSPTSPAARMGSEKRTTTDANGDYTLDALEPGEETIEFTHPKYIATKKNVTLKGGDMRLDAQLSGGQRVSGVVVTEAGTPVADVEVYASASGGSRRSARTNASGTFEFESLAPARYRFSASKSGYAEGVLEDFDISAGTPVRITLRMGGTIYGRVTGLSRDELSNAVVEARSGRNYASANVDSAGNFKIEGAPVGTVQVLASVLSPALTGRRTTPTQTVEVDAGSARQVDLEFRTDLAISGRVTHNRMPVKGASVSFQPRGGGAQTSGSTSTDEEGRYTITGLEDGEYNVMVVDMQRLNPYNTTYQVRGSATFNIDYETSGVRGRVIDSMNNEPIAGANVQLRTTDPNAGFGGTRATITDASGVFIFESIAPGSYVANATKDGFGNQTMDLSVGERGIDNLELKLARNDGVTLKVVDARDGRTLDAVAFVFDAQGRLVHESRMMFFGGGTEGATETRLPLAPGSYTASVTSMGYALRTVSFRSPSTQTVALTPGGTLILKSKHSTRARVRLIDSNGIPYPRFGTRPPSTDLNPSPGRTVLEHLAPGTYTLQLLGANDVVTDSVRVTVIEGQTVSAEI